MERVIQVNPNEYYRPVHDRTLQEYAKIGKPYKYTADEQAEQKKWDFVRYADNTYRFNVQVIRLVRVLDERDGNEYINRMWKVTGKSEIGNDLRPFTKIDNIDTYKFPVVEQKIVAAGGQSQSLKTVPGQEIQQDIRYLTPFTVDNVIEVLKDSMPPQSLRFLKLYIKRHNGMGAATVDKKHFIAWLLAPYEYLEEYYNTRASGINLSQFTLEKYKDHTNEFQKENLEKILASSNIVTIDDDEERQRQAEEAEILKKGLTVPDASQKEVTKIEKISKTIKKPERDVY